MTGSGDISNKMLTHGLRWLLKNEQGSGCFCDLLIVVPDSCYVCVSLVTVFVCSMIECS